MSAAEPTLLDYIAETIAGLLPWAARIRIDPVTKALSIRSASETIAIDASERIDVGEHAKAVALAGGGPALARVSDLVVRFTYYPGIAGAPTVVGVPAVLYVSTSLSAPYAWAPIAPCATPVPLTTDAGTAFTITTGSGKATSG